MHIKAILFDIDGTLIDSNDMHVMAWEEAFAGIGRTFERSIIHGQIGKGADMLIPTLLPQLDEDAQKALAEDQGRIFKERYLQKARPFPQAHQLLAHVHQQGQKIVLATSSSQEQLEHYLDLLDARELVTATTSSGDVQNTKPAPDIFSTALSKLPGLEPADVLAFGDTPYDVEAAAKCGVKTVAVRSGGFPDDVLRKAGAVAIYDDVSAILADYDISPLGKASAFNRLESDEVVAAASMPT